VTGAELSTYPKFLIAVSGHTVNRHCCSSSVQNGGFTTKRVSKGRDDSDIDSL
jgi:hypothetical protein